jgi:hypothetical protein
MKSGVPKPLGIGRVSMIQVDCQSRDALDNTEESQQTTGYELMIHFALSNLNEGTAGVSPRHWRGKKHRRRASIDKH